MRPALGVQLVSEPRLDDDLDGLQREEFGELVEVTPLLRGQFVGRRHAEV